MPLAPTSAVVERAVTAAIAVGRLAADHRAGAGLHVSDLARLANRLQAEFDAIKPLLAVAPAEAQSTAAALYGSRAPADVLAMVAGGQAAGAAVVGAIAMHANSPATLAAWSWHDASGQFVEVGLTGEDIAWLHAPLDALIGALAPVAG